VYACVTNTAQINYTRARMRDVYVCMYIYRLCSFIHCEYSISIVRVTYAIDFEHSRWILEHI